MTVNVECTSCIVLLHCSFAGGDLLSLPLNFALDLSTLLHTSASAQSENNDGGRDSESDYENQGVDSLVPCSPQVEKEFKDLRYEVGIFCREFDRIVAGHVSRETRRSSSESQSQIDGVAKPGVDGQLSIMVLTYCDLVEMNAATLSLLTASRALFRGMKRNDASLESTVCNPVIIFAPSCVQERLVVELKLALDRWQRGDAMNFAAQSFDFSGGGSVYSRSSGHSSIHSISMSPLAQHSSINSISGVAVSGTPRGSSRWPSLRSRSASTDRSSAGSRGNSKIDMNALIAGAPVSSAHTSINSQHGNSLVNMLMPSSTLPHKDSGSISSFFHSRSRHSNDSIEPFSHLDRVDSGSLLSDRLSGPKMGILSASQSFPDAAIPGRIIRNGSSTTSQSRPGSGGVNLPPPPPPLSNLSAPSVDLDPVSPSNQVSKDGDVLPSNISERSSDPCQIILQVVRRIQLEHAVSISVFV